MLAYESHAALTPQGGGVMSSLITLRPPLGAGLRRFMCLDTIGPDIFEECVRTEP